MINALPLKFGQFLSCLFVACKVELTQFIYVVVYHCNPCGDNARAECTCLITSYSFGNICSSLVTSTLKH